MIIYPGAFNMTTGPLHWELLQRSRANDNQLYVVTTSPARDENAEYVAWGHSTVVNPWGQILKQAAHSEDLISVDIGKIIYNINIYGQMSKLRRVRFQIFQS